VTAEVPFPVAVVLTIGKKTAPAAVLASVLGGDIPDGKDLIQLGEGGMIQQILADAMTLASRA
jgi:hypothetical protein